MCFTWCASPAKHRKARICQFARKNNVKTMLCFVVVHESSDAHVKQQRQDLACLYVCVYVLTCMTAMIT